MFSIQYNLPSDNGVEKGTLPAATYKATVTGLNGSETVLVETWNGSAWTTAATLAAAVSGIIGGTSVVIPASGRVRCTLTAVAPAGVKVRISA